MEERRKKKRKKKHTQAKIYRYRRPMQVPVVYILFGLFCLYVAFGLFSYLNKPHIKNYEVQEGSLSSNKIYKALALRDELVVTSSGAGTIHYYAGEGMRAALGDVVCLVDGSGRMQEYLDGQDLLDSGLDDAQIEDFRNQIRSFMHDYSPARFEGAYAFKQQLRQDVVRMANAGVLESLGAELSQMDSSFVRNQEAGILSYWVDGLEDIGLAADLTQVLTEDLVSGQGVEKTLLEGGRLVADGDALYKVNTREEWILVFLPESPEVAQAYVDEQYIKVRFLQNQYEAWARVSAVPARDGNTYVRLDLNHSMLAFVDWRYLDIELLLAQETGLKIPLSAIVDKDFYLVPEAFVQTEGRQPGTGLVTIQGFDSEGNRADFTKIVNLYHFDEEAGEYFVDVSFLDIGAVLLKNDSQEVYTISRKRGLTGVYNMNKGYADFRQIQILEQNDAYAIVKSNTVYGLRVFDYIVLDAGAVKDSQLIHEPAPREE